MVLPKHMFYRVDFAKVVQTVYAIARRSGGYNDNCIKVASYEASQAPVL